MTLQKTRVMILVWVFWGLVWSVFAWGAEHPVVPKLDTSKYPTGELGRMVQLGEDIMNHTYSHPLTKEMVGNRLNCKSCHLTGIDGKPGTAPGIGTFIGTAAAFPAYSKREKTVQSLQDRINNCFMRSMNGKRPVIDTEAGIAMAAYMTWLSRGLPVEMDEKRPCGLYNSARWAKNVKKFAQIQRGAAWVQSNMPLGQGETLTDQEAADVMLYVNAQPRADFDLQKGWVSDG